MIGSETEVPLDVTGSEVPLDMIGCELEVPLDVTRSEVPLDLIGCAPEVPLDMAGPGSSAAGQIPAGQDRKGRPSDRNDTAHGRPPV